MSGILADAFSRAGTGLSDHRSSGAGVVAMAVGALVGMIPGALLGNESRKEEANLGRGVVTLLDVGGTVALGFAINQVFTTNKAF